MQKLFDVLIRCTDKRLPTILQACDGALELQWVKAAEVYVGTTREKTNKGRTFHYVNGKHDKGVSGVDLAMQLMKAGGGKITTVKLAEGFVAKGFAANSASPVLSKLKHENVVEQIAHGVYRLKGTSA